MSRLRFVEGWHRADLQVVTVALDAAVVLVALLIAGASIEQAGLAAASFGVLSPLLGLARHRTTVESQGVLWYTRPVATGIGALFVLSLLQPFGLTIDRSAAGLAIAAGALLAIRVPLWLVVAASRRRGLGLRSALVVGAPAGVEQMRSRLATYPEAGLRFEASYSPAEPPLPTADDIEHIIFVSDGVDEAVFQAFTLHSDKRRGYTVVLPLAHLTGRRWPFHIGDLGVLPLPIGAGARSMVAKRVFDVVTSAALLLVMAPVLGATALAIWFHDRGPVIFRQRRVGLDGRPFVMFKFRSMVVGAEHQQRGYVDQNVTNGLLFRLSDDPRITPVGALIRRLAIDELPQLFNVLKGDMSLVGPRPLAVDPDDFVGPARVRHTVPPGITGPWQVEGGNALAYSDMVNLDLTYVATRSFGYDLQLLARTVPAVITRRSPS